MRRRSMMSGTRGLSMWRQCFSECRHQQKHAKVFIRFIHIPRLFMPLFHQLFVALTVLPHRSSNYYRLEDDATQHPLLSYNWVTKLGVALQQCCFLLPCLTPTPNPCKEEDTTTTTARRAFVYRPRNVVILNREFVVIRRGAFVFLAIPSKFRKRKVSRLVYTGFQIVVAKWGGR